MDHIGIETLIKKFERQLSAGEEHEVSVHLAECVPCRAEEQKLAEFFSYARKHSGDAVPQAVTARILNLYQRKPQLPESAKALAFSNIASLIFDDWQMAVNERFSGVETRQLLYRIGKYEIDLRLEFVGEMCRLTGQIFPEQADAVAELSGLQTTTVKLNEFGEFMFDLVPQGEYDLCISIKDEVLVVDHAPLHQ